MFQLCVYIFITLLFFILTPGILLTFPSKSSKKIVALVHALIFSIILSLSHKFLWKVTEGFATPTSMKYTNTTIPSVYTMKIPDMVPSDMSSDMSNKMSSDMSNDMPKVMPDGMTNKMSSDMPNDMPKNMPKDMQSQMKSSSGSSSGSGSKSGSNSNSNSTKQVCTFDSSGTMTCVYE